MEPLQNNHYYTFGKKSITAKTIRGLLGVIILFILTAGALLLKNSSFDLFVSSFFHVDIIQWLIIGGLLLGVVLALVQVLVAWLAYKNTMFMLSENALYIRSGILTRTEISVPLRHIQNIHQTQTLMDRLLGVSRCEIEVEDDEVSATTNNTHVPSDVVMHDMDIEMITLLREELLSRSNTQRMVVVNSHNS